MATNMNRRRFFQAVGGASLGSMLAASNLSAKTTDPNQKKDLKKEEQTPKVAKRKLGKTGLEVPMLSLGGMFDIITNQIVLIKAIEWGVTYWDTAHVYNGGKSESGIGSFLKKKPEMREKLFLVSKASRARSIDQIEERIALSLERLNTNYIDLYYGVHGLKDPEQLTDDLRTWSLDAKKRGIIKHFGFSTHSNTADCMLAAAKTDYIDAIMTSYNFRHLNDSKMQDAISACHEKGIAVIAMKTQAGGAKPETDEEKKLTDHFLKRGFTLGQAKLKAVWADERISAICSQMPSIRQLVENVAAALDKTKLTKDDLHIFGEYAAATCGGYCAGCESICSTAVADMPYTRDVMRYMMYHHHYGDTHDARAKFAQLPHTIRENLDRYDYRAAEKMCPNGLPIGELMREAKHVLA